MSMKMRRAFTLVEMLVVIAIIILLMALVSCLVQQNIEMARQNTCKNNMKQLGLAMISLAEQRVSRLRQPRRSAIERQRRNDDQDGDLGRFVAALYGP